MNSTDFEQCALSQMLVNHSIYIFSQLLQIAVCLVTLVIILLWRRFILKQLVNENEKLHHIVYDFIFVKNECDLVFSNFACLFVKCFTQCFNINLSLLFICLCIERTVATYSHKTYTDHPSVMIYLIPIITFLLSLSSAGYVFSVDALDPLDTASCLFNTPSSWLRVNIMYYSLIGVNTSAMFWFLFLYAKNRRLERGMVISLNSRYQVKENIHITKIILVCGSVQLAVTLCHEAANSVRRAYVDSFEMVLYREMAVFSYLITYANLLFILMLYLLLRIFDKRNQNFVDREKGMRHTLANVAYFPQ